MSDMRITLEDHGQDILRFTIRDGIICESNLQTWLWYGRRITNEDIKPGDFICFDDQIKLKYPVETVTHVPRDWKEEFDYSATHNNDRRDDYFCCPHCLESNHYSGAEFEEVKAVDCSACTKPFAIWLEQHTSCASAPIPQHEEAAP